MKERNTQLEKLEQRVSEARNVLDRVEAAAESERERLQHEEIEHLENHLKDAELHLRDIESFGDECWDELKHRAEDLWHKMGAAISGILEKLKP